MPEELLVRQAGQILHKKNQRVNGCRIVGMFFVRVEVVFLGFMVFFEGFVVVFPPISRFGL